MADAVTQDQLNDLKSQVLSACPTAKLPDLETDIKSRANQSLGAQLRFLTRVRDAFEMAEASKYLPEPVHVNGSNSGVKKAASTNPWSAVGWNVSEQGRIAKTLGAEKAASLAKSAGCKLGSTRPNPHFN
jgi:hypothetical protein